MSKFVATFVLSLAPLMCVGQSVDDELLAAFNQDQSSRSNGA